MRTSLTLFICLWFNLLLTSQHEWEIIETDITEPLHDIEFINDSLGFMYSYGTGNIYATDDYGYSWELIKQTDSIYYEQIQFINSNVGWICGEYGKILKTLDGGITWADLSIPLKDKNLLLYGMYFLNDTVGYVSGAEKDNKGLKPKVFITRDGGNSWSEVFDDIPKMILSLNMNGDKLFATGTGFIIGINLQSNKWEYVLKDTLGIIGQIRDMQFANDNFGMAVSFKGKVLKTSDGGRSFYYEGITNNRLRSIAYLGDHLWMAAGDNNNNEGGVLFTSYDNGISWHQNNSFPDIHRIYLTDKCIWIVGKNGLIAKKNRH